MQGYDSYFMDTDIQIGGTDQTFNMQAGRTLQKDLRQKDSFVMTNVILEGTDGRKMSKSWGNAIWLDEPAEDMYAKVMAINDDLIVQYYTLATDLPLDEIKVLEKNDEHPMQTKKKLASIIVTQLHNKEDAEKAAKAFESRVQKKELPTEMETIQWSAEKSLLENLVDSNLVESKSEAKRLIAQGGISIDSQSISDPNSTFSFEKAVLKLGKRRFVNIEFKK
jgi:tyrosyl-tRNA synthetase